MTTLSSEWSIPLSSIPDVVGRVVIGSGLVYSLFQISKQFFPSSPLFSLPNFCFTSFFQDAPNFDKKMSNNSSSRSSSSNGSNNNKNNSSNSSDNSGDKNSSSSINSNDKSDGNPKHVAVIMDGNRRFGKKTHSDPLQGHWSGGQTLVDFVQWCIEDGVEVLTVYAFSSENWSRGDVEVNTLMRIISKYAKSFLKEALERNVKVNVLCTHPDQLPCHVKESIEELESSTAHCTGFVFNICLSYGGRADLVQACQCAAKEVQEGKIQVGDITEAYIESHLLTKDLPPPDMLIRTSGEFRVSNFLLWQIAYSELFFVPKLWPEITQSDLKALFSEYKHRNRRFGC